MLPKQAEILKELDRIHAALESQKKVLKSTQEHIKVHDCAPGRKRLARATASIKELEESRAAVLAKEKDLYKFAGIGGETGSKPTPSANAPK